MSPQIVDSHCHLDMIEEDARDEAVARAVRAGVRGMLTICTSLNAVDKVAEIARKYGDHVAMAAGVHPHRVGAEGTPEPAVLEALIARPDVAALGETGLDYFYDKSPRDAQQESFRRHIAAAKAADAPFIVHTREADEDTISILEEQAEGGSLKGVLHCFSSGRKLAERAVALGMHVSFSGILTFKNAMSVQEVAADIPMDRILVETDAPFLAPIPMRGKPNEPAYTVHTARKLAELKGVSEDEIAEATTRNFAELFPKAARLAAA